MRSPVVLLALFVLTAVLGPVVVIAGLLGVEEKPDGIYQWCLHTWCRAILKISGVKLVVTGAEKLSSTHGVVHIANHVSWYDIFALASVIPRSTWIAKAELRKIPLFVAYTVADPVRTTSLILPVAVVCPISCSRQVAPSSLVS